MCLGQACSQGVHGSRDWCAACTGEIIMGTYEIKHTVCSVWYCLLVAVLQYNRTEVTAHNSGSHIIPTMWQLNYASTLHLTAIQAPCCSRISVQAHCDTHTCVWHVTIYTLMCTSIHAHVCVPVKTCVLVHVQLYVLVYEDICFRALKCATMCTGTYTQKYCFLECVQA